MDAAELKDALLALLDDPDVRAKLREAVRTQVDGKVLAGKVSHDVRREVAAEPDAPVEPIVTPRDVLEMMRPREVTPEHDAPDPRSPGVRAAVARGEAVPAWIKKLPGEKA